MCCARCWKVRNAVSLAWFTASVRLAGDTEKVSRSTEASFWLSATSLLKASKLRLLMLTVAVSVQPVITRRLPLLLYSLYCG